MTMRLARCALVGFALAGLVACGGGGGDKETPTPAPETMPDPAPEPMPEMRIMPKPDEPGTIVDAVAITGDDPVSGNLSSPTDVDMFRLALDEPSTVTFWTTGEAETVVTLVDGDGNNLSAAGAGTTTLTTGTGARFAAAVAVPADSAGRVSVTTGLDNVYARVTGRPDGRVGNYDLVRTVAANAAPVAKSFSTVTVKAGGAAVTVDMSDFFTDPEGGALKFSASLPPASFGPVSLGLTVSGSVLSIISPEGLTPGPVSITVTATDPFGLVTVQVLSVTVQPPDSPTTTILLREDCVTVRIEKNPPHLECSIPFRDGSVTYQAVLRQNCDNVRANYQWSPSTRDRAGFGLTQVARFREGREERSFKSSCLTSRPRFRFCLYLDNVGFFEPTGETRCLGNDAMWQYVN